MPWDHLWPRMVWAELFDLLVNQDLWWEGRELWPARRTDSEARVLSVYQSVKIYIDFCQTNDRSMSRPFKVIPILQSKDNFLCNVRITEYVDLGIQSIFIEILVHRLWRSRACTKWCQIEFYIISRRSCRNIPMSRRIFIERKLNNFLPKQWTMDNPTFVLIWIPNRFLVH